MKYYSSWEEQNEITKVYEVGENLLVVNLLIT